MDHYSMQRMSESHHQELLDDRKLGRRSKQARPDRSAPGLQLLLKFGAMLTAIFLLLQLL
jgi:hypothetical protein